MTSVEAEKYTSEKQTDLFDDFTSRFGRPFSAKLVLKDNGRHGFEFLKREGGATRKKATRKKTAKRGTRKKGTRKKAARKTSAVNKAVRKSPGRKSASDS